MGLIDFRVVVLHFYDGVTFLLVEECRGATGFEGGLRSRLLVDKQLRLLPGS